MTAGAQGHPGWVDNHPTTLKFLAASQACLHPYTFSKLQPTIREKSRSNHTSSSSIGSSDQGTPLADSPMEECSTPPEMFTATTTILPLVTYRTNSVLQKRSISLWELNADICLPEPIADDLLSVASKNYPEKVDTQFVSMFSNINQCKLRKVDLRSSKVTDEGLEYLLNHNLTQLDIRECDNLTSNSYKNLNRRGDSLYSLAIGKNLFENLPGQTAHLLNLCQLRNFTVNNLEFRSSKFTEFLKLSMFENLSALDLSGCADLADASGLANLKLTNLTLYNCTLSMEFLDNIIKITTLRFVVKIILLELNYLYNRSYIFLNFLFKIELGRNCFEKLDPHSLVAFWV